MDFRLFDAAELGLGFVDAGETAMRNLGLEFRESGRK